MSTNPFESDSAPSSSRRTPSTYRKQRHYRRDMEHSNLLNLNETSSSSSHLHSSYNTNTQAGGVGHQHNINNSNSGDDNAIWEARNIDWPLSSTLPAGIYNKLYKTSLLLGNAMGMTLNYGNYPSLANVGGGGGGVTGGGDGEKEGGLAMEGVGSSSSAAGGYYGAFGGLMGKFMKNPNQNLMNDLPMEDETIHRTRTLRPPRQHCLAAANGWIVTSLESIPIQPKSSTSNASNNLSNSPLTTPPLRLVTRWNVRRGATNASDGGMIPLTPPIRTNATQSWDIGRILHVFMDPTASHVLLSAANGELYYLHSTTKAVRKLNGFGPNADGSGSCIAGRAYMEVSASVASRARTIPVQRGVTPKSYVTAVAWDKKRGTEGSTKKILFGTSLGELYEYSIKSPNAENQDSGMGGVHSGSGGEEMESDIGGDLDSESMPLLLVRLNSSSDTERMSGSSSGGGGVSGLHFERLGGIEGDLFVLAATSGFNQHTRLHTYLSVNEKGESSIRSETPTFRTVFSSDVSKSRNSFVELPGSIHFADLKLCGDGFAMKTETGIYYGTIDRSDNSMSRGGAGISVPWNKGANGIIDAGILPFEESLTYNAATSIPTSIAITPHHIITLNEYNELRFISRVAKKTIQKERVSMMAKASGGIEDFGELIMDPRRPDQIWLRKARVLVHISSNREDRDIWKFTLQACLNKSISPSKQSSHQPLDYPIFSEDQSLESEFEHVKSLCSNDSQRAVVTAARAQFHLLQGRVELAAKYMAMCPSELMPFAETAIRLAIPTLGIHDGTGALSDSLVGGNVGLISYLSDKLRAAKARNDSVACTMIGAWLAELYLHERESAAHEKANSGTPPGRNGRSISANSTMMQQFLTSNAHCMDAKTILNILISHDVSASECAGYAASSGDIGTAVNAALSIADLKTGAVDTLQMLNDYPLEEAEPYYYKHAFTLLARVPMAAAKSFLGRYAHGLSAIKLLPSFMQYERQRTKHSEGRKINEKGQESKSNFDQISHSGSNGEPIELSFVGEKGIFQAPSFVDDSKASITYLEGAITLGCEITAIFNYLISLYAKMEDEEPLFSFLSMHLSTTPESDGTAPKQKPSLDLSYALRVLLKTGRHYRSVVRIYMGYGMRQRAVELAIKVDPVLAKELAGECISGEEKKRLWLMIARNAAEEEEGSTEQEIVSKVLAVLNECGSDVLSIEDVLPFLPDLAQIDQFKDEICEALTSYSSKIEDFLKEMNECDQTCSALREEIRRLNDYSTMMKGDARCALTRKFLVQEKEPFYVFPSGFCYLEGALKEEVMPYLNDVQRNRVKAIKEELKDVKVKTNGGDSWDRSSIDFATEAENLQAELDGLIAAECPLTGTVMVESIDRCFIDSKEDERYINFDMELV